MIPPEKHSRGSFEPRAGNRPEPVRDYSLEAPVFPLETGSLLGMTRIPIAARPTQTTPEIRLPPSASPFFNSHASLPIRQNSCKTVKVMFPPRRGYATGDKNCEYPIRVVERSSRSRLLPKARRGHAPSLPLRSAPLRRTACTGTDHRDRIRRIDRRVSSWEQQEK